MKLFKTLLFASFLCLWLQGFAQDKTIDALKHKLQTATKPMERYVILSQLDGYYMQIGRPDSLETVGKQLLAISQQMHSDLLFAQTYIAIGNSLAFRSDLEGSLEFYFKALHIAEKLHVNTLLVLALNNIGGEYEDLENFGEAEKYTRRALRLISPAEQKSKLPVYLNWHLAFDNYNTGNPKEALRYLAIATSLNQSKGHKGARGTYIQGHILWVYAMVAEQMKNKPLAEKEYRMAVAYNDSLKMATPLALSLNSYSKFLYNEGRYAEAKKIGQKAMGLAVSKELLLDVIRASGTLSKVYTALRQPDSANRYYQVRESYQEKVFNKQRLSRLQDLTFTEQLRQQEEQAKLAELEEQRKNNLQYGGIAIALITFTVIFLIVGRSAAASPRLIEFLGVIGLLILFEFINLLLHPFIGKFTHDSPPLTLLLMVFLAGLLVPLHHKMEGFIKQKFIKGHHTKQNGH